MNFIDRFLNDITMYRLVLYALCIFAALGFLFSGIGILPYPLIGLAVSLALLLAIAYGTEILCARLWKRERNPESAIITALILFLLLAPPAGVVDALWVAAGAFIGIASKYVLSYRRKHVFNPAALAVFALTVLGSGMAIWWVASPALFPAVLILGLCIVRKLRRFDLWFAFMGVALVVRIISELVIGTAIFVGLTDWFVSWPTLFFSTIMLTEPLTIPPTKRTRRWYGAITGAIFPVPFSFGGLYGTPQLALLVGNVYAFIASPKGRSRLTLAGSEQLADSVVEFTFRPERPFPFRAGQYAEWTLPHADADDRGARRYFTLASAPEEVVVRLAVRVGEHMSTFKRELLELPEGAPISISNVAGDFTLPVDPAEKLLFVAGGVGITPYASMIRSLITRSETRDVVLVYLANGPTDFAYGAMLREAEAYGVRTLAVPSKAPPDWNGVTGVLTAGTPRSLVPDTAERLAYVSGPEGMVKYYTSLLTRAGAREVKTDYFPGL